MRNILLLSFNGEDYIEYDEKPEFETIVNTWKTDVIEYPHPCLGIYYSPTQRHGEAMYIQSKILRDLNLYYDYVASYCHDLKIKVSEINRYFRIAHQNDLDCFGPSLTLNSYISHKQFAHTGTTDVISRDWIEIMAIGFSKRLYEKLIYHLDNLYGELNLVGGWGLDAILIKDLIFKNKYKCAMIDEIKINHFKPVTRGEVVWRNGKSSRDCRRFIENYKDYIDTNKLKTYVKQKSSESKGRKPFYTEVEYRISPIETPTPIEKVKPDRNLIVQIYFDHTLITNRPKTHTNHNRGPLITSRMLDHQIFEDSQRITQEYAKKCGAEYIKFNIPVINFFSPSMERMRLIEEEKWARDYDNILYLDCDTIINDKCPNLFQEYPQHSLRVCPTLMSRKWLIDKESTMVSRFGEEKVCDRYFNGGVILFHKSTLNFMRGKLNYRERFNTYAFDDQSELNWVSMEYNIPMTMMSRKYNSKPGTNVMITHYLGSLKNRYNKGVTRTPHKNRRTSLRFLK